MKSVKGKKALKRKMYALFKNKEEQTSRFALQLAKCCPLN
jgi:hypothetical protein